MNLATFTAAALLLATIPQDLGPVRDEVGCIDVNHVFDAEGKEYLVQVLYWQFHRGEHKLTDWRLFKSEAMRPRYDYARQCYVARWQDGGTLREVTAPTMRETYRHWDEELEERSRNAFSQRRKLTTTGTIERSVLERRWTE